MDSTSQALWRLQNHRRFWARILGSIGMSAVAVGCMLDRSPEWERPAAVSHALGEAPYRDSIRTAADQQKSPVTRARYKEVARVPEANSEQESRAPSDNALPISLETVFRLAEEQNAQLAVARERLNEAFAEKDVACSHWLPDIYVGAAYYRHEGGIQNEDGTLTHSSFGSMFAGMELNALVDLKEQAYRRVNAERKVWQQRGELSKVTSETLLDASNTYVDLLTARTGEAIARSQEKELEDVLDRTKKLANVEPAIKFEVPRIEAELAARKQAILKLREQAAGASAKLIYLLGLDPSSKLLLLDGRLVAFDLVDPASPADDLVAQALQTGPGIQEMEGLLSLIQESIERAQGPGKYLPIFGVRMAEGGFGAGPGDRLDWDNRWDLGLQARWNLTEFLTAHDRRRAAAAKIQQAQLAYQDLRGKLTAGVQEAREAIVSGKRQIKLAQQQLQQAREAHKQSDDRLKDARQGSSPSEVLLALRAVAAAELNNLTTIAAYDKAQLRLFVLLGPEAAAICHPRHSSPRESGPAIQPVSCKRQLPKASNGSTMEVIRQAGK